MYIRIEPVACVRKNNSYDAEYMIIVQEGLDEILYKTQRLVSKGHPSREDAKAAAKAVVDGFLNDIKRMAQVFPEAKP